MIREKRTLGILLAVGALAAVSARSENAVTDWNNTAITAALAANQITAPGSNSQPGSILYLAYVHLAIYDAVTAIDHRFAFYGPPIGAPADASVDAAVAEAAYRMLLYLFPDQGTTLTAQYNASLAVIPDSSAKTAGMQAGLNAANSIIALRTGDGRGANVPYSWPSGPTPGVWIPTPPGFLAAALPWLSKMTPFTMQSASWFRPEPPYALTSEEWAGDYNQVKALGALNSTVRTAGQTVTAFFWTEHVGMQYSRAFRALATAENLNVSDTARLFAMLYTAGADALIGCWEAKYHYSFWRPVTAIENGAIDENPETLPDPAWLPITATPNHPEYPSAHGCVTGSVTTTLKHFFGTPSVTVVLSSSVTNTSRTFNSVEDWEHEVEMARIYAGFHYHHSVIEGAGLGRKVSNQLTREYFQPLRSGQD